MRQLFKFEAKHPKTNETIFYVIGSSEADAAQRLADDKIVDIKLIDRVDIRGWDAYQY